MLAGTAALGLNPRPAPAPRKRIIEDGVLGMLLFVFTEAMLFAGFISAHAIVRAQAVGRMWPPYGQPRLPIEETAFNTAALLVSGIALIFAHFAYKKAPSRAVIPFLLAILLGMFFVVFQGVEWVALIGQGLTLTSSTYGSFFYLIVGMHAAHAVAALGGMVWAWYRLRAGTLTASQFGTVQVFWYFVVLLWPVLYLKVYL
jgi:cytochrome c oxidase subunit III